MEHRKLDEQRKGCGKLVHGEMAEKFIDGSLCRPLSLVRILCGKLTSILLQWVKVQCY